MFYFYYYIDVLFLIFFLILFIYLVFSYIFKDAISYHVFEDITISSLFELFIFPESLCFFQTAFYVYWFCALSSMLEAFLRCLWVCNGFFLFNCGTLKKKRKRRFCACVWGLSIVDFLSDSPNWAVYLPSLKLGWSHVSGKKLFQLSWLDRKIWLPAC